MGRNPQSKESQWRMVERHMQGNHRRRTRQAQDHTSLSRRTSLRTSQHQLNKRSSGQVLLVAATSQGHSRICQRMRSMSTEQSKHTPSKGPSKPYYANDGSITIPDDIYELYCETTRISRIQFHLNHHRPQLHKNANCNTLKRNDNG